MELKLDKVLSHDHFAPKPKLIPPIQAQNLIYTQAQMMNSSQETYFLFVRTIAAFFSNTAKDWVPFFVTAANSIFLHAIM